MRCDLHARMRPSSNFHRDKNPPASASTRRLRRPERVRKHWLRERQVVNSTAPYFDTETVITKPVVSTIDPVCEFYTDAKEKRIFDRINGRRRIAEIVENERSFDARAFFQKLWQYDQVVFDTSNMRLSTKQQQGREI